MHALLRRWLFFICATMACCTCTTTPTPSSPVATPTNTHAATARPLTATPLPVVGEAPNPRLGAFYYAWYGNPRVDGTYIHWEGQGGSPPDILSSDYYPLLGDYSSNDPAIIEQHMAWLRQAGVGFIVVSWWGPNGTNEARPLPLILDTAARYGIQVALHIEPYTGRSNQTLATDVRDALQRYGDHPAFMRTTLTSPFKTTANAGPIFFLWSAHVPANGLASIPAAYWQPALDEIHAFPEQPLMIADTLDAAWVSSGHFDGIYNYATLDIQQQGFTWAQTLPPGALYIPSIIPGFSAQRIGYAADTFVDRNGGTTYDAQWRAALGVQVEPALVTITSFNEWHEGSQIEPAIDTRGPDFSTYAPLSPHAYLERTREWSTQFAATTFPVSVPVRITLQSTSDWSTLELVGDTAMVMRPALTMVSEHNTMHGFDATAKRFFVNQSLSDAQQQRVVELQYDVELSGLDATGQTTWQIGRGSIGATDVTIATWADNAWVVRTTYHWDGISDANNHHQFQVVLTP